MTLRISDTVKPGRFRVKVSAPVTGKGRPWVSVGTRSPLGWLSLSKPVSRRRGRR